MYTCYVVERNRLLGVVSARSLLLSDMNTPIADIMDDNVVTVKVTDDQEYVAREMQRYDFTAMPVLDNEGMFVVPDEKKTEVMSAINQACGLKTKAHGVVLSLPVDDAIGLA